MCRTYCDLISGVQRMVAGGRRRWGHRPKSGSFTRATFAFQSPPHSTYAALLQNTAVQCTESTTCCPQPQHTTTIHNTILHFTANLRKHPARESSSSTNISCVWEFPLGTKSQVPLKIPFEGSPKLCRHPPIFWKFHNGFRDIFNFIVRWAVQKEPP